VAQSFTNAHQQYVQRLQQVAAQALKLNAAITDLANFFNSSGVQGAAMTDAEIQAFGQQFAALTAAQVNDVAGGGINDLKLIQAVMTPAMQQRFANLICGTPTYP
jgi:superoxide dismutase